jgi:LPS sulfotransferase NodH
LLSQVDKSGLKKALENEILASFKSPVAFKNVICGFHASFLTEIHPASLFIHIKRDPYTASASILKARMTRYGSYDTWWSLKPSSWPFNTQPGDAAAEVATQVMECRREIDEELSKPGVKSLQVTYEELCTDTQGLIEKICHKLKDMGSYIDPVSTDYPALTVSAPPKLPDELEKRLKDFFS